MSGVDPAGTAAGPTGAGQVAPGAIASSPADGRLAGSGPTSPLAQALPVAPVLVRDYRRLLRLFPYSYRRAHEAEMLGHVLDGSRPGQSRPSRAERWDLVRAAAREWLLAPLGSTPPQRRAATGALFVLLPAVLVLMAVRVVAFTATLTRVMLGAEGHPPLFPTLAVAPMWALWLAAVGLVLAGARRVGQVLAVLAAAVGVVTLVALVATGDEYAAYLEVPWVLGVVAYAAVVVGRTTCHVGREPLRLVVGSACAMALVLGAYVAAAYSESLHLGVPWWSGVAVRSWTLPALAVPAVVVLGLALLSSRTRQAVPVLSGLATAMLLSRSAFFWSGNVTVQAADLGNVVALLVFAGAVTVALRWVVNRLDELSEARASHRALLAATDGVGEPRPGGPTAI
jgi:hypothetical protein